MHDGLMERLDDIPEARLDRPGGLSFIVFWPVASPFSST